MANTFTVNVYQTNNKVWDRDQPQRMAFPSVGVMIGDNTNSAARSLLSGYNVYSFLIPSGQTWSTGDRYHCAETVAQIATLAG